jgi:hypothetical protein
VPARALSSSSLCRSRDTADTAASAPIRLASGDVQGIVLLWAVNDGRCIVRFSGAPRNLTQPAHLSAAQIRSYATSR